MLLQPRGQVADGARPELVAARGHASQPQHQRRINGKLLSRKLGRIRVLAEDYVDQHRGRAIGHGQNPPAWAGDECR